MGAPALPSSVSVALIAHGIIERKVKFGLLVEHDFSSYIIPGGKKSYLDQTMEQACREAWELVRMAESTRPKN